MSCLEENRQSFMPRQDLAPCRCFGHGKHGNISREPSASVMKNQVPPNIALQRTCRNVTLLAGARKPPFRQPAELDC